MKEAHIICNAHLDPIWQWRWEEGVAAAISTFKSAENLMNEFDYVFCHNEAFLYECVEQYAPALFKRIQKRIKEGKWRIMGGWYIQPDCNMPSGESMVRQIQTGKKYFKEKFGVEPKTAVSCDAFGHNIGLVQIIKKCGQDNYMFMRPQDFIYSELQFIWEGLDGSAIKCERILEYSSPLGRSVEAIAGRVDCHETMGYEIGLATWGMGNHGGGPSSDDLKKVEEYIKGKNYPIYHSDPDSFFAKMETTNRWVSSIQPTMPGCYTSMIRVKQKHIELENSLYFTEKICTAANQICGICYPDKEIIEAQKALLFAEFHDILPGTCIKKGEEYALNKMGGAIDKLNALQAKALFTLANTQQEAVPDEYPFIIFNPHPYTFETEVELNFGLADTWTTGMDMDFRMEGGQILSYQEARAEGNKEAPCRKKYFVRVPLKPFSVTKIYAFEKEYEKQSEPIQNLVYEDSDKYVEIDAETGLLKHYIVHGEEQISDGAFGAYAFEDIADPWGYLENREDKLGKNPVPFALLAQGAFNSFKNINVIEDGELYKKIECFYALGDNEMRTEYTIWKKELYIDINIRLYVKAKDTFIKLKLPLKGNTPIAQCAYGTDTIYTNGTESVLQRFLAVQNGDKCLGIFNKSIYGCSYEDGVLWLNLVRTAAYCANATTTNKRYIERMDQGEIDYSFRLTVCKKEELEREALEFTQRPYAESIFPVRDMENNSQEFNIRVSDKDIVMSVCKKEMEGTAYILRFFNNSNENKVCDILVGQDKLSAQFSKYEVKTYLYLDKLTEIDDMRI